MNIGVRLTTLEESLQAIAADTRAFITSTADKLSVATNTLATSSPICCCSEDLYTTLDSLKKTLDLTVCAAEVWDVFKKNLSHIDRFWAPFDIYSLENNNDCQLIRTHNNNVLRIGEKIVADRQQMYPRRGYR